MSNEDNKILKNNREEESFKAPVIRYADLCKNNLEKCYTEKKIKHTLSGCSLFTNCLFDETKNKPDCYRGENCMERF